MSFSLNIFVPPEDPSPAPVPAPSVSSSPIKESESTKQETTRKLTGASAGKDGSKQRRDFPKQVSSQGGNCSTSTTPKSESKSSKIVTTNVQPKSTETPGNSAKATKLPTSAKLETKTTESKITETDSRSDAGSDASGEDSTKHSRKNPEHRPRQRAPLSLIRQIRSAPTEEAESGSSTHLFAQHKTFESMGLFPALTEHVVASVENKGMGLAVPTKVQSMAIPHLLKSRDALIKSETGSGKTLAFLLPMLHSMITQENGDLHRISREDGTYALVLSPTRELCLQIYDVLVAASKPFHWIVSTAIVGGEKKKSEKARLRKGVNIIVATPGRLADHLRTTYSLNDSLKANPLRWLVLDEADRLLDTGFEKQVQEILDTLQRLREEGGHTDSQKTQTVLLSATITSAVEKLAGLCLENPARVDGSMKFLEEIEAEAEAKRIREEEEASGVVKEPRIITVDHGDNSDEQQKTGDQSFVMPKQLVQHYLLVESADRLVSLAAYLRKHIRRTGNTFKTLVFVSSRASAEFLHAVLSATVWPPQPSALGEDSSAKLKAKTKKIKNLDPEDNEDEDDDDQKVEDEKAESTQQLNGVEGFGTKWFVLHGSVDQKDRRKAIKDFALVRGAVLICTDVAARGLDLPSVDLVVQYDPPSEISEYVHRVGRTARSGRRGAAVIFLREAEAQYLEVLKSHGINPTPVKHTYESLVPPPPVDERTGKRIKTRDSEQDELQNNPEMCKVRLQQLFESMVSKDDKLSDLARNGYLSWVGAYSVHSAETKHIFITRELHFGHVARSFALKDAPTKIKQHHDELAKKKEKKDNPNRKRDGDSTKKSPHKGGEKKRLKKFDPKSEFEA